MVSRSATVLLALLASLLLATVASAAVLPESYSNFTLVDSNHGAYLFWWFMGAPTHIRDNAPLVVYLQGGPGASSLFAAFCEVGPVDACQGAVKSRPTSWLNYTNLLFIDSPVGTGFSYAENPQGYATNEIEVANDLLKVLIDLFRAYPKLETNELFIFGESYGGKMVVNFANRLHKAKVNGELKMNLIGVALGDSWISPVDCTNSYGSFLKATSFLDANEARHIDALADVIQKQLEKQEYIEATNSWGAQQADMTKLGGEFNIYNFMQQDQNIDTDFLTKYINTVVAKDLGIPATRTWTFQNGQVFVNMSTDFMKPATAQVNQLLANGYAVNVYNGQLDIIVNNICTETWVNNLSWDRIKLWQTAPRNQMTSINGQTVGFYKKFENLSYYWILGAGHMVPMDQPLTGVTLLKSILNVK